MAWTLAIFVGLAVVVAVGLQVAISRDGPGVLSNVDRLLGGSGGAQLKAKIAIGEHPQQKLLIWGAEARDESEPLRPVLVFVHGGSWRWGDPESYDFVARAFVDQGFIVALGGYRLGEAGKYPAMLEDTARSFAWVKDEIEAYGGDPEHIVIAGHSAGAYNVMMLALDDQWLAKHELATSDIAGVIGLSGPYDFLPLDSESTIASFGHVEPLEQTQPVNHISKDAPPMLLIHGEKDTLVGMRHSRTMDDLITKAGGDAQLRLYPDMTHNDPLISIAAPWRSSRDIVPQMAEFVRQQTTSD